MVNAVAESVALDLLVYREWAVLAIVVELHLGSVKASLAIDEIANGGIFDNHLRPEWVAWEAEKVSAVVGGNLDDDVGPAGENVFGFLDLLVRESLLDDLV